MPVTGANRRSTQTNHPVDRQSTGWLCNRAGSSHFARHAGVTNYSTESASLQLTRCSKVKPSIAAFRTIDEDFMVCSFQMALYFGRSWRACPRAIPSGCFGELYGEEGNRSPCQIDIYSRRYRWFFLRRFLRQPRPTPFGKRLNSTPTSDAVYRSASKIPQTIPTTMKFG